MVHFNNHLQFQCDALCARACVWGRDVERKIFVLFIYLFQVIHCNDQKLGETFLNAKLISLQLFAHHLLFYFCFHITHKHTESIILKLHNKVSWTHFVANVCVCVCVNCFEFTISLCVLSLFFSYIQFEVVYGDRINRRILLWIKFIMNGPKFQQNRTESVIVFEYESKPSFDLIEISLNISPFICLYASMQSK